MIPRRIFVAAAASVMALLPAAAHAQAVRSPRVDDVWIRHAVEARLEQDSVVHARVIVVRSHRGVVTLTGQTHELAARARAGDVAETVRGVRAVVNRIDVAPVASRSDEQLREGVEDEIRSHPVTESFALDAAVSAGRVTLTGAVDSQAEKDLAEKLAGSVTGVTDVDDEIVVRSKASRPDAEIEGDVNAQLQWDPHLDGESVHAQVDRGVVTLSGTVGSVDEKRQAQRDAQVGGVRDVDASRLGVARRPGDHVVAAQDVAANQIESAIRGALFDDPRVVSTAVKVSVSPERTVTLRGEVANVTAADAAQGDAWNTRGVQSVRNKLAVEPDGASVDTALARTVRSRLEDDPYVRGSELAVAVEDGAVRLAGVVPTNPVRQVADDIAWRVSGVRRVENDLVVSQPTALAPFAPFADQLRPQDSAWYYPRIVAGLSSDECSVGQQAVELASRSSGDAAHASAECGSSKTT